MEFMQSLRNRGAKITPKTGTVGTSWTQITGIGSVMGFIIFNSDEDKTLSYSFDGGTTEYKIPPLGSDSVDKGKQSKLYVKGSGSSTPYELTIGEYQ